MYQVWFGQSYPGGKITPKHDFFERIDMLVGARVAYNGYPMYKGIQIRDDAVSAAVVEEFGETDDSYLD